MSAMCFKLLGLALLLLLSCTYNSLVTEDASLESPSNTAPSKTASSEVLSPGCFSLMIMDSDQDSIPDALEGRVHCPTTPLKSQVIFQLESDLDTDGDGNPDYLDLDSDNDSITDLAESGNSSNIDADNDGVCDNICILSLIPTDTDQDGTPDYLSLDSDSNGISDLAASRGPNLDLDKDGRCDFTCILVSPRKINTDEDSSGAGILTAGPTKVSGGSISAGSDLSWMYSRLQGLTLSSGTLSPTFDSTITSYSATVSTSSITVTPTRIHPEATITVNGVTVNSGSASGSISLDIGNNTITIIVSKTGLPSTTHTLTITRLSNNADLSAFALSSGSLSPAFSASTITYTASVTSGTSSMTVTPTVAQANATVTVNSVSVTSGQVSSSITLNTGDNVISVVVTAQDTTTTKTYTLTVTRPSTNADLSALSLSSGSLSPAFAAGTISYTASVVAATSSITVTPTVAQANATVTVNAVSVASGVASGSIALVHGYQNNTISVVVTAQDGSTTKTYTILFTRGSWVAQAYLKPTNPGAGDIMGQFARFDGDTAIFDPSLEDSNQTTITNCGDCSTAGNNNLLADSGAAIIFRRTAGVWAQEAYLKAPNASASDWFGYGVGISGDTVVIGAVFEDNGATTITNGTFSGADSPAAADAGAAYVMVRSGTTWSNQAYLKAPNAGAGDAFGIEVAISGDTIAVAARDEDNSSTSIVNGTFSGADSGTATSSGAVYIYKRSGTTWTNEAYIKAPNAGASDEFYHVAISGDTLAVGARLEDNSATTITNGTFSGADSGTATSAGAVYVFSRSGTTWSNQAYLKAPNAGAGDELGRSLSISGDTIVAGAVAEDNSATSITNGTFSGADSGTATDSGAAYVFVRSGTTWSNQAYLKAPNAGAGDNFGNSVSISGELIAIGAPNEDNLSSTIVAGAFSSGDTTTSSNVGAVYIYARNGTTWTNMAYIKAPNARSGGVFGFSVCLSSTTLMVGTHSDDSNQNTITNGTTASSDASLADSGAGHVFGMP